MEGIHGKVAQKGQSMGFRKINRSRKPGLETKRKKVYSEFLNKKISVCGVFWETLPGNERRNKI